jgi:RNA polymerase sigma-70 factor (ECF subfamily)
MPHGGSLVRPLSAPARVSWSLTVVTPSTAAPAKRASLEALDDRALVERCLSGSRDAFDLIVERHRRAVYQVCYRFVDNHEDASDLSQETFIRAWRGLRNFKHQAALSTWLYRIAVNVCLNRVAVKTTPTEPLERTGLFADASIEPPGSRLVREERAALVRRAIAALPKKQRATLILRAYHDLPHRQIADILGSSVGAVKANFFHALANLKRILGSEP